MASLWKSQGNFFQRELKLMIKDLFQPVCFALIISWLAFVVTISIGAKHGDKIGQPRDGSYEGCWSRQTLQIPLTQPRFTSGLQNTFDIEWKEHRLSKSGWAVNASREAMLGYKLIVLSCDQHKPRNESRVSMSFCFDRSRFYRILI